MTNYKRHQRQPILQIRTGSNRRCAELTVQQTGGKGQFEFELPFQEVLLARCSCAFYATQTLRLTSD